MLCLDCQQKIDWTQPASLLGLDLAVHIKCFEHFNYTHPLAEKIMGKLRQEARDE